MFSQENFWSSPHCSPSMPCPNALHIKHAVATHARFDVPAFYLEARRVLKPGGALAVWFYYFPRIEHHSRADQLLRD